MGVLVALYDGTEYCLDDKTCADERVGANLGYE